MVTYLASLVQLCCGEGGTLQTNITGMCAESSQCLGHSGFAPSHGVCAFPVYTAQAPGCCAEELCKVGLGLCALPRSSRFHSGFQVLHKGTDSVVPAFCALLRSEQLRQPGAWRSGVQCILSPPWPHPLGFLGAQIECCLMCAMCLFWGADL